MGAHREEIRAQLQESCRVKQSFPEDLLTRIEEFAVKAAAALGEGGKLVFFGNGGSAADAQHMAAELVVRLRADRPGLAALALTTNPSVLTAASNDYGFEHVFARQIESLVSPGDVLVALSTSGNSPNIVRGVEAGVEASPEPAVQVRANAFRMDVSRAVANKYAYTPQGVYELRFFFSEAVQGPSGGGTSLINLKRLVKKMIEEEDPAKPFTDEQITQHLREQGITVTRRTVAKYREDMRIPSTHQRRVKA